MTEAWEVVEITFIITCQPKNVYAYHLKMTWIIVLSFEDKYKNKIMIWIKLDDWCDNKEVA